MLVKVATSASLVSIFWVALLVSGSVANRQPSISDILDDSSAKSDLDSPLVESSSDLGLDPSSLTPAEEKPAVLVESTGSSPAGQKRFKVITITIPIDSDSTGADVDPITIATNEVRKAKVETKKCSNNAELTENKVEDKVENKVENTVENKVEKPAAEPEPEYDLTEGIISAPKKASPESKPGMKKNESSKKNRSKRSAKDKASETSKSKESRKSNKSYEKKSKNKK